ncbi:hypothetical protein VNO80_02923 [Phaseolus coccineus]|uniref:Uncharacterized protein n=1 Tax=Phaseolus coccineus TaxID=3886 RepID=A0AAN9NXR6_PHACN
MHSFDPNLARLINLLIVIILDLNTARLLKLLTILSLDPNLVELIKILTMLSLDPNSSRLLKLLIMLSLNPSLVGLIKLLTMLSLDPNSVELLKLLIPGSVIGLPWRSGGGEDEAMHGLVDLKRLFDGNGLFEIGFNVDLQGGPVRLGSGIVRDMLSDVVEEYEEGVSINGENARERE